MNSNQHIFLKCLTLSIVIIAFKWGMCATLYRLTSIFDPRLSFSISRITLECLCMNLKSLTELTGWLCRSWHPKTILEFSPLSNIVGLPETLKFWFMSQHNCPGNTTFEDSDKIGFGHGEWERAAMQPIGKCAMATKGQTACRARFGTRRYTKFHKANCLL